MSAKKMDKFDKDILSILQEDSNITNKDLSEKIGLAPSSTLLRVKDLKEAKIIKNVVALVDEEKLGYPITSFTKVTINPLTPENYKLFIDTVKNISQVIECYSVTGSGSFLLKILMKDFVHYHETVLQKIMSIGFVTNIESSIVTKASKSTTSIPVE